MDGRNQEAGCWTEHREINMVMLGTSLAPEEFLGIQKRERVVLVASERSIRNRAPIHLATKAAIRRNTRRRIEIRGAG